MAITYDPPEETEASRERLIAHLELHGWYMTLMAWVYVPGFACSEVTDNRTKIVPSADQGLTMFFDGEVIKVQDQDTPPEHAPEWPWPKSHELRWLAATVGLPCPPRVRA